ncbi:hypothetical protein Tco_0800715 [Tanacetum coccineum]|uniref:Uncharacterized protein n=1 Tax=Tanacetum coccineum TaxID=301880 RepID=A0ABQ4ZY06_9ASTR
MSNLAKEEFLYVRMRENLVRDVQEARRILTTEDLRDYKLDVMDAHAFKTWGESSYISFFVPGQEQGLPVWTRLIKEKVFHDVREHFCSN